MFVVISQALRVDFPLFYLANINEFKFERSLANSTENGCFHPRRQSFLCSLNKHLQVTFKMQILAFHNSGQTCQVF